MPHKALEIIFGSYHQADEMFSQTRRGNQCVPNALSALIIDEKIKLIHFTYDLDEILKHGDLLYIDITKKLGAQNQFTNRLLSFEYLPETFYMHGKQICLSRKDIVSGCALIPVIWKHCKQYYIQFCALAQLEWL